MICFNRIMYIYQSQIDNFNKYGICIATCSGKVVYCHEREDMNRYHIIYDGVWRVYLNKGLIFDKSPIQFNNAGRHELWELRIIK